jgi:hypothetical protein
VEKLLPYGAEWVKRLGEAFFALNEDRTYLSNIVERLLNEAKLKAANEWKALFTRTADGQFTTKESLAILLDAREKGYKLGAQSGGAFTVSIGSSTSFLYSNEDIRRFGHILAGRPTSSKPAATTENGKWRSQTGKLVCNYELSGLPPPQTTTSLKIECSVSRYLNGTLGTHLRFYLTPYLYLIPHARPFEDHLVKASFALGLVADGSGLGTETSPLVQGGMFEVNASAYEDDPDTVVLGIISSRDTALALKTLAIGTVLTLTLIEHETEPLLYPLRLRLNGDPNFAKLYERLQRSA